MPDLSRKETYGRFGTHPVYVSVVVPASPVTANSTVYHRLATPPRGAYFGNGALSSVVVAVDNDGTCLATFCKYDASAAAYVALTTPYNIESLTTLVGQAVVTDPTLTVAQRTFDTGDCLVLRVVNDSAAVDTQPTLLNATAELFLKD